MKNFSNRRHARRELVIDRYHGYPVADPYRWLEDDTAPEVIKWIDEQNTDFEQYISQYPLREELKKRLTNLWHYEKVLSPTFVGGKYYTWRNNGLQNQNVLYESDTLDAVGEVVFDPNLLSEDGTKAITSNAFSPTGRYYAYGISSEGSDWETIHILDLQTRLNLPDELHHIKFSTIAWLMDESGFFYSRFPDPKTDDVLKAEALNNEACLHMLGDSQSADKIIHKDSSNPEWGFDLYMSEDKKWLFMASGMSTLYKNHLYFKSMENLDAPWQVISDNFEEGYTVIGVVNDTAYIHTQKDAPHGMIFSMDLLAGTGARKTVIHDQGEMMEHYTIANDRIICSFLHHAANVIKVFDLSGRHIRNIDLPCPGTAYFDKPTRDNGRHIDLFISFSSFLYPGTVLKYNLEKEELTTYFTPKVDFNFSDYETIQDFAISKDGTKVPLFITYKKGMEMNGKNPTILYGYGGFNISMAPSFSASSLVWLERGGVYAVGCMRGGSEYGEAWHRGGMLESKQNTFDDFIACGEHLIAQGFTRKEQLGIFGGSNGGLLTGACLTQRPDLYGAVVVAVPVLDMLRFHLFTAGRYWVGEYGSSDDAIQFEFLMKYSPLHNVKMNVTYPASLIMTADTDDRVVPMHARKFAATLQAADGGDNPILIRIEKAAGHGMGKPTTKIIESSADMFAFFSANLLSE